MSLIFDATPSSHYHVHIYINSDYGCGGWTETQSYKFKNAVYPKLLKLGYEIKEPEFAMYSPDLVKGRTKLYLHPRDFYGYATEKDIEKITNALNDCPECIYGIDVSKELVYELSDFRYKHILCKNMDFIINYLKDYKKRYGNYRDANFEFARKYRIPRYGDKLGLSSDDCDVDFVNIVIKILENIEKNSVILSED